MKLQEVRGEKEINNAEGDQGKAVEGNMPCSLSRRETVKVYFHYFSIDDFVGFFLPAGDLLVLNQNDSLSVSEWSEYFIACIFCKGFVL
ncbi:MAG: hypothetical protein HGA26_03075 [Chlorobiaceae bacterium]|nr:hypothetical protein [Chlorobiaceae bacterium]